MSLREVPLRYVTFDGERVRVTDAVLQVDGEGAWRLRFRMPANAPLRSVTSRHGEYVSLKMRTKEEAIDEYRGIGQVSGGTVVRTPGGQLMTEAFIRGQTHILWVGRRDDAE